ncbi:helix-turn-helix domain-containing protein [Micromonospora sp. DT68]|uniref:helix-turn-helix domain-containing protein n=1 Tax=Micromonospora TaxID=1873 RepID=UPI0033B0B6DF
MNREAHFDFAAYAGYDTSRLHTNLYSWDAAGWRALLVQSFDHLDKAAEIDLPATSSYHVWLVVAGQGTMRIEQGNERKTVPVAPGLIGGSVGGDQSRLRFELSEPMSTVHLHLPGHTVRRVAAEMNLPTATHIPSDDELLPSLLPSLASAARRGAGDLHAQTAAEFLAVHLLGRPGEAERVGREDKRVHAAIELMNERMAEPLRLADLAREVHLSTFHFLRVFRQTTGLTPARYLTRLRIDQARRYLERGMGVGQTAIRCGFGGTAQFSAAFLRETGIRPSAYRMGN